MKYALPGRLGHVLRGGREDEGPVVYLMPLPDGRPIVLIGSAALIWLTAVNGAGDVPGAVARSVGLPRGDIADDVERYLDELLARGLLEMDPAQASPADSQ